MPNKKWGPDCFSSKDHREKPTELNYYTITGD